MNGLHIDQMGGHCPFQAEGTIDGHPFYFRSRGNSWRFSVGSDLFQYPDWSYSQEYGTTFFEAGWISDEEALGFIELAANLWREAMAAREAKALAEGDG